MKEEYKITFYSDSVYEDTLSLPDDVLAHLLRIFDLAKLYGSNLGLPQSRPLGDGLFEFRASGKEGIARSIFVTLKGKEIVILHTVIKKSRILMKKDLDLAKKRAKEIK